MNKPCRVLEAESALLPDGYVAVYHAGRQLSYVIPPLGGIVWELCDGEHSVEQIVDQVKDLVKTHGGGEQEDLAIEVTALLKKLSNDGLLAPPAQDSSV